MYKNVIKDRLSMLIVNGLLALMMVFGSFGAANAQEAGNRILLPLVQAGSSEAAPGQSLQAAAGSSSIWDICFQRPTLRRSYTKSTDVAKLQYILKYSKGFSYLKVDGYFGTQTYYAVKSYQLRRGLDDDGIVGPITWKYLC